MSVTVGLKEQDFVIGSDAMYIAGRLDKSLPRRAPPTLIASAALCRSCPYSTPISSTQ